MTTDGRTLTTRAAHLWTRMDAWLEAQPRWAVGLALILAVLICGPRIAAYPLADYPLATWHMPDRGIDVELGQAKAAKAGWPELFGYWVGPTIHGHGYYRPLTSWLFVLEWRLFGAEDRLWSIFNITIHVLVLFALGATAAMLVGGRAWQRAIFGAAAVLWLGGPGLAPRDIEHWIIGWWPCQSEGLSLLFGLGALSAAYRAGLGEERPAAWVGPLLLGIAICFKEMAYVAAIGCLFFAARQPRDWRRALPYLGVAGFFYLLRMVRVTAESPPLMLHRLGYVMQGEIDKLSVAFSLAQYQALAIGLAVAAFILCRRRYPGWAAALVAAACYLAVVSLTVGPPDTGGFRLTLDAALFVVKRAVLLGLCLRACADHTGRVLMGITIVSRIIVLPFALTLGWYRYWFSALLILTALYAASTLLPGWAAVRTARKANP